MECLEIKNPYSLCSPDPRLSQKPTDQQVAVHCQGVPQVCELGMLGGGGASKLVAGTPPIKGHK